MAAIRAESVTASAVAARSAQALWDVDQVAARLVRSGVAPRRVDPPPPAPEFFAGSVTAAFVVGREGDLRVYIFPDSAARHRVTDALDADLAAPRGGAFRWPEPPTLIAAQNLAAVLIGGNSTLKERVQLALEAGLPGQ